MLQVLLCVTSMGYIVCYIYRFVLVSEIVEFLRSTYYEQFISLAFLTTWDEVSVSIWMVSIWMVSISVTHFSLAVCLTLASVCLAVCSTCVCACLSHSHVCLAVCPTALSVCLSCSICSGVCLSCSICLGVSCSHVFPAICTACICPILRIGGLAGPQSCLAICPILCVSRNVPEVNQKSWLFQLLRSLVGLLVFLVVVTQGLRLVRYCPHLAKFAAVYRRARREVMLMAVSCLPVAFHFDFQAGSNGGMHFVCLNFQHTRTGKLTHLAPDHPSPPILFPYCMTPDHLVVAG